MTMIECLLGNVCVGVGGVEDKDSNNGGGGGGVVVVGDGLWDSISLWSCNVHIYLFPYS